MFTRLTQVQRLVGRKDLGEGPRVAWAAALGREVEFDDSDAAWDLGDSAGSLYVYIYTEDPDGSEWSDPDEAVHKIRTALADAEQLWILDADAFAYLGAIGTTLPEVVDRFTHMLDINGWTVGSPETEWLWVEWDPEAGPGRVRVTRRDLTRIQPQGHREP